MFTLSAEVQREAAERVCRLIAGRLALEAPADYSHPWEILVDGYLPVEVHFHRSRCFFVGVISEYPKGIPEELMEKALHLSKERCAMGYATVCIDSDAKRLLLWKPAGESGTDNDILGAFSTLLKELDLWFATLIEMPGSRSTLRAGFTGLSG